MCGEHEHTPPSAFRALCYPPAPPRPLLRADLAAAASPPAPTHSRAQSAERPRRYETGMTKCVGLRDLGTAAGKKSAGDDYSFERLAAGATTSGVPHVGAEGGCVRTDLRKACTAYRDQVSTSPHASRQQPAPTCTRRARARRASAPAWDAPECLAPALTATAYFLLPPTHAHALICVVGLYSSQGFCVETSPLYTLMVQVCVWRWLRARRGWPSSRSMCLPRVLLQPCVSLQSSAGALLGGKNRVFGFN